MTSKLKTLLIFILNIPLYFIAKLTRKDPNIWIFGAWFGDKYADNSKALFEYVNSEHPEIRAIWLSSNKKVIDHVKSRGYTCYCTYSMKAIRFGMRAQFSIFVHSNSADCMHFLNNGKTQLVQLWHGIPLKRIGYDDTVFTLKNTPSKAVRLFFPFIVEKYEIIISCSDEDKTNFISAFRNESVRITGYPRNDILNKKSAKNNSLNIMYLPTFRDDIGYHVDLFTDYNFELEKWVDFLAAQDIALKIKMHPVNKPSEKILKRFSGANEIQFLEDIDIAEQMTEIDILITDYSSVYFDFLLLNKPIIFTPFDFEKYITKDRELYYNYNDVTPGPKCTDWRQVLNWVERFIDTPSAFTAEREITKNRFHLHQDGRSCERVYKEVIELVTR